MGLFGGCDYLEGSGGFFGEYRCKYSNRTLSTRTAEDICMTSRYLDCADYKNASRCFITTAVCLGVGKPDDCEELMVMRAFRDNWLRKQPDGQALIEDYYRVAPGIVEKIDQQPNRASIFRELYDKYVLPCVQSAQSQDYIESERIYVDMVNSLKEKYA